MDECLNDALFLFFLHRYPPLLDEPEVFRALHDFVHSLLVEQMRTERSRLNERVMKVSTS